MHRGRPNRLTEFVSEGARREEDDDDVGADGDEDAEGVVPRLLAHGRDGGRPLFLLLQLLENRGRAVEVPTRDRSSFCWRVPSCWLVIRRYGCTFYQLNKDFVIDDKARSPWGKAPCKSAKLSSPRYRAVSGVTRGFHPFPTHFVAYSDFAELPLQNRFDAIV